LRDYDPDGCQELMRVITLGVHLSTNMCPAHRLAVLDGIRARLDTPEPTVCVSTQLIEAGVDISFGSCIRALAGIDSIAQAAGHSNRHGERSTGPGGVHVINLKGSLPRALSDIRVAQEAAQRVLDENTAAGEGRKIDLADPKLIEQYFRYYFLPNTQVSPSGSGMKLVHGLSWTDTT
jgi:CRISPR-associated endonuclease/helicase Cas3